MTTLRHPFILLALSLYLSLFPASQLKAETYITEEKVQIDRCACAWFISRFQDESPTFVFIKQGATPPKGITYDFFGATYFHKGPDCSFTAFVKKHIKKKNQALINVNAVVNDVFAWRDGPNSLSVAIKKHIDHLAKQGKSDAQIYQVCNLIFDLLYLVNKGNNADMTNLGKKSQSSIKISLINAIYPSSEQVLILKHLQKAPTSTTSNLYKILKLNKKIKDKPLYQIIIQILKTV